MEILRTNIHAKVNGKHSIIPVGAEITKTFKAENKETYKWLVKNKKVEVVLDDKTVVVDPPKNEYVEAVDVDNVKTPVSELESFKGVTVPDVKSIVNQISTEDLTRFLEIEETEDVRKGVLSAINGELKTRS